MHDDHGHLLLIRRGRDPGRGHWSLPGGRVEAGETDQQAVAREVLEETGITVSVRHHVGSVTRAASGGAVFDIHDYTCRPTGGTLCAGDDADDARWCDAVALAKLPVVDGLIGALAEWDCLPR